MPSPHAPIPRNGVESGVLGPRVTFAEQRSHDGYENGSDDDLGGEGEPEAPTCRASDQASCGTTHDAKEDCHEAANRLHARNEDSGDEPDDYAGAEAGEDAVDFHIVIQSLFGRGLAFSGECHDARYRAEVLLAIPAFEKELGE